MNHPLYQLILARVREFTREPDVFLGLLIGGMSMGQLLSIPMVVIGAALFIWAAKRSRLEPTR